MRKQFRVVVIEHGHHTDRAHDWELGRFRSARQANVRAARFNRTRSTSADEHAMFGEHAVVEEVKQP